MRGFIGAIGLAIVLVELNGTAQTPPDFSGTWNPVESNSAGCFGSFTVTQDAATLSVAWATSSARPDVYRFDGTETRQTIPETPLASPQQGGWIARTVGTVTRAAWFGDRLVAVNHVAIKMLWPGNGPGEFDLENTFQQTLSLDASGRLVIERLSILDPYPGGSPTHLPQLPNSWKCTYAKSR